jgi:hypothetical protein
MKQEIIDKIKEFESKHMSKKTKDLLNNLKVENQIKERMKFLIKNDFILKEYNNHANINEADKWLAMLAISTLIYTKNEYSKLYLKHNS